LCACTCTYSACVVLPSVSPISASYLICGWDDVSFTDSGVEHLSAFRLSMNEDGKSRYLIAIDTNDILDDLPVYMLVLVDFLGLMPIRLI
jgi:hypothetical protein